MASTWSVSTRSKRSRLNAGLLAEMQSPPRARLPDLSVFTACNGIAEEVGVSHVLDRSRRAETDFHEMKMQTGHINATAPGSLSATRTPVPAATWTT